VGNLFTGVATFIILSLVNSIVVEQHPSKNMPPCAACAAYASWAALGGIGRLVIPMQEFHDVEGDRASGKRTLPLVLGEAQVWLMRYATCWLFLTTHTLFLLWEFVLAQSSTWYRSIWHCGTGTTMHSKRRVKLCPSQWPILLKSSRY